MAEEEREVYYPQSNAKDIQDADRNKAVVDTLYPGHARKPHIMQFVERWVGPIPDKYDEIAAGIQFEMSDVLRSKALAVMKGNGAARDFDWTRVAKHPIIRYLGESTVSMGGGKGRKEGVELGKANPPIPQKSRWSWNRGGKD
jgi:hypothetical protein